MERFLMTPNLNTPFENWLSPYLLEDPITDILVNGNHSAFCDQGAGLQPVPITNIEPESIRAWALQKLSESGKSWDARFPFMDLSFEFQKTKWRMHVAFSPMTEHSPMLSLRRLRKQNDKWAAENRWGQSKYWKILKEIIQNKETLMISGATGSGKTTLMNDLLTLVDRHERMIALEDTRELNPDHNHFYSLTSRAANAEGQGEVSLRDLLKQTLRMRPDRIVLGECRSAEVLDLLQALNTGHRGTLATLHANSARDAVKRLEWMALLHGGSNMPLLVIRELIANGIQWIVQTKRQNGARQIEELWKIQGREGETLLMRKIDPDFLELPRLDH